MLKYKPEERISAQNSLNSDWITKNAKQNPLDKKVLEKLREFSTQNQIKTAILTFIATQIMNQKEKEELLLTFQSLDLDGDGILSKEELISGYTKVFGNHTLAITQADKILSEVDHNYSGKIDFTGSI